MSSNHEHIGWPYRIMSLYIEPLAAAFGAYINLADPASYLQSLSPFATSTTYSSITYPVYAQIAGHLVFFLWIQAVLLRSTPSAQTWKIVLFGILLCDLLHLYGDYVGVGTEDFFDPRLWRKEKWIHFGMTYGPGSMRVAFCMGIGVGEEEAKVKGL